MRNLTVILGCFGLLMMSGCGPNKNVENATATGSEAVADGQATDDQSANGEMTSQVNYDELLDDEVMAFVRKVQSYYPPGSVSNSPVEQRRTFDIEAKAFYVGRPEGVEAKDSTIPGPAGEISIRRYTPGPNLKRVSDEFSPNPTVFYIHGGGFVVGNLETHDDVCAGLCAGTGMEVIAVDYRLAPEHSHPASFDDTLAAFQWTAAKIEGPIIVCGDSAGGNLAAGVSHVTRGKKHRPAAQLLIYPGLSLHPPKRGSYVEHANAPLLTLSDVIYYQNIRNGDKELPEHDASFAPLSDTDFSGLPPTVVFNGQCDPIADDGKWYCARIKESGGKAERFLEMGLTHEFLRARHVSSRAGECFSSIIKKLSELADDVSKVEESK